MRAGFDAHAHGEETRWLARLSRVFIVWSRRGRASYCSVLLAQLTQSPREKAGDTAPLCRIALPQRRARLQGGHEPASRADAVPCARLAFRRARGFLRRRALFSRVFFILCPLMGHIVTKNNWHQRLPGVLASKRDHLGRPPSCPRKCLRQPRGGCWGCRKTSAREEIEQLGDFLTQQQLAAFFCVPLPFGTVRAVFVFFLVSHTSPKITSMPPTLSPLVLP